ncbi:hypothetical protein Acy02nite_91170 [Actinoplanes cyaneus]|uniref:Uncharacterized protein n=1 Tax=Actinoplanes cyaneus TaxID=52696 RepID=A0A919IU01_9ACTN|nr:hypothetical protein [Actinoplanes cyaneus]MCW2144386.1 hypothetical protein [Actinoplanes cyaneus]GID71236.1 hypothetical protein Acy02nite_91170 [Actinoplanes cyaneus]
MPDDDESPFRAGTASHADMFDDARRQAGAGPRSDRDRTAADDRRAAGREVPGLLRLALAAARW